MKFKFFSKSVARFLSSLAVLLLGLVLSGCSLAQPADSGTPASDSATPVTSGSGVIVEGRLVPARSAWLSFQTAGEVAKVLVEEGQSVQAGDVLAVLGNPEAAQAELMAAQLELTQAQQALDDLNQTTALATAQAQQALVDAQMAAIDAHQALSDVDTQAHQDDIDSAWTTVQDRKDDLDDAQETFDKYQNLDEDNTTRKDAQTELDDAQKAYDDAVRVHDRLVYELKQAQADADLSDQAVEQARQDAADRQNGPDADELSLTTVQVASAQARVDAAQKALDLMSLTAPFDGVVTSLELTHGETVAPGQAVIRLADFSQWYVETTDLDEIKVARMDASQPVALTLDALPGLSLSGTVERISLDYSEKSGDILYTARIRLDNADPRLRWGMTLSVTLGE